MKIKINIKKPSTLSTPRNIQKPGLLLLGAAGQVLGAPKINTDNGQIMISNKTKRLYLKTTDFNPNSTEPQRIIQNARKSPKNPNPKIPGLDLTSKEKKVRDSIPHVPEVLPEKVEEAWKGPKGEVLPEKGEEAWKGYQGRGFLKKIKIKEEQVWEEFRSFIKDKEDFPNWEIIKRPKKTQNGHNGAQKETIKSMKEGDEQDLGEGEDEEEEEEEEEEDEDEGEQKDQKEKPIKKMKTMKTQTQKFPREDWNELFQFINNFPKLEIVKRRPKKRTPRQKVSYQIRPFFGYIHVNFTSFSNFSINRMGQKQQPNISL